MSGLGIAFPLEAAAPLIKAALSNAPHMVRPALITGLGAAFFLLCSLWLLPLAGWLAERSRMLLRHAGAR